MILLALSLIGAMLGVFLIGLLSAGVLDVAGALWWVWQKIKACWPLTRRG